MKKALVQLSLLSSIISITTPNSFAKNRIIDGQTVPEGKLPYVISLPNCTATMIGPKTFITAGHCIENSRKGNKEQEIEVQGQKAKLKVFPTHAWRPYAQNGSEHPVNDLAIGILEKEPLNNNNYINICLKQSQEVSENQQGLLIGFGNNEYVSQEDGYPFSGWVGFGTKRFANVIIKNLIQISDNIPLVHIQHVGSSTIYGDSGGPTFIQNAGGVSCLLGITSMGDVKTQQTFSTYLMDDRVTEWLTQLSKENVIEICGVNKECPNQEISIQ